MGEKIIRFFIHESVYQQAGGELAISFRGEKPSFKFLNQCLFINVRFHKTRGHISYTTKQIEESVKSEDYANHFQGFMVIGENMAFPISKIFDRNKNLNLVKAANIMNVDTGDEVVIVVYGIITMQAISKIIEDGNYPIRVINLDEALVEIIKIHESLKTSNS